MVVFLGSFQGARSTTGCCYSSLLGTNIKATQTMGEVSFSMRYVEYLLHNMKSGTCFMGKLHSICISVGLATSDMRTPHLRSRIPLIWENRIHMTISEQTSGSMRQGTIVAVRTGVQEYQALNVQTWGLFLRGC